MSDHKILFFIDSLKHIGGAEQMFIDQANYFVKKEIDTYFAVSHQNYKSDDFSKDLNLKHKVAYFRFESFLNIKSYLELMRYIKKNKISIIYSYLDYSNNIARLFKIIYPRIRVVIVEPGDPRRKTKKMRIFDWFANFFVYKIFAMGSAIEKQLIVYLKIHKRKILSMRNGVHPMLSAEELEEKAKRTDQEEIYLLHVGNISTENKGHAGMIEAVKLVHDQNLDLRIKLFFVGEGHLSEGLKKLAEGYGLKDVVDFVGRIPHGEIKNYYKKVDIFIFNSKTEGGAASIMEATSAGLPVVSSHFESAREVVIEGETGFLVERGDHQAFADKIVYLSNNRDKRVSFGRRAYQFYRDEFEYEKQADMFIRELFN